jgi:hypothetical protein
MRVKVKMEELMERVSIPMPMEKHMRVNGKMENHMDMGKSFVEKKMENTFPHMRVNFVMEIVMDGEKYASLPREEH